MRRLLLMLAVLLVLGGCGGEPAGAVLIASPPAPAIVEYTYEVVATYPHDPRAFTQGLAYVDGILYEGTGLSAAYGGQSTLRRVDLASGDVEQLVLVDSQYFGEGIVVWQDRILQLTWQARQGFIYDRDSFEQLGTFSYPTEGWGITHDGARLIVSDGTDSLYFWEPESLAETGRIAVRDENGPVVRLNELEYIDGDVWANVWQTDTIVRIDPATGHVTGRIDLSGLLTPGERAATDVLNGIAHDPETGRIFVTGKYWPHLFEIEIVRKMNSEQ